MPNILIPARATPNWMSDLYETNPAIVQKAPKTTKRAPQIFMTKEYVYMVSNPRASYHNLVATDLSYVPILSSHNFTIV